MFKILLGAGLVVALVAGGIITGADVQQAGDALSDFVKNDARAVINSAAVSVKEATDQALLDKAKEAVQ